MRAKVDGLSKRAKVSIRMNLAPRSLAQRMAKKTEPAPVLMTMSGRCRKMVRADAQKFLKPAAMEPLHLLVGKLEEQDSFSDAAIEAAFIDTMETTGLKLGKIAQPVRVALTGKTVSPGIFEIIRVLGKEKTLERLKQAVHTISRQNDDGRPPQKGLTH